MGAKGWRERVDTGLYRAHRLACAAGQRRRTGRRCDCPYELQVPARPPRRSRTITFAGTITQARAERHRLLGAGLPAPPRDPGAAPANLDELAGRYLAVRSATLEPNTIATTERHYVARITAPLGGLALHQLDRARIEGWLAAMIRSGVSRHAVAASVAALRGILSAAVEWELIERNPAKGLRLPAPELHTGQAVERVLSLDQVHQLRSRGLAGIRADGRPSSPRAATMILTALEAGLRKGEVIGLRWPDFDLAARSLTVRRSVSQTPDGRGGSVKTVKTTKGRERRELVISPGLAARLGDWQVASIVAGSDAAGYVWPGRDGGPMDKDTPGQTLGRVLDRAGLTTRGQPAPVTFHGLRHTCASILLAAGQPLIVVSRQLGHSTPVITATRYAHLIGDDQLARAGETVWRLTEGMEHGMEQDPDRS